MSETIDLSVLGAQLQDLDRQLRLVRLQLDTLVSSGSTTNSRLATIEQGFHNLTAEMARGFGQMQQQLARHTQQLAAVQTGLAELKADLQANHAELLAAIRAQVGPPP